MRTIACIAAVALCLPLPAHALGTSFDVAVSHGSGSSGHSEYARYERSSYGAGITFHFGPPGGVFNDALSLAYRHGRVWGDTGQGWQRLDERYDNVLLGNLCALGNRWLRAGPAVYVGGTKTLEMGYGLSLQGRVPRRRTPDIGLTLGWIHMSEIDILGDGRDTDEFQFTASLRWGD